jgi:hypothetical protein
VKESSAVLVKGMSFPFDAGVSPCCCVGPTGAPGPSPAGPGVPGPTGPTGPPAPLRTYALPSLQTAVLAAGAVVVWSGLATQVGLPFVQLNEALTTFVFLASGTYQVTVQLGVNSSAQFQLVVNGAAVPNQDEIAWNGGTNAATISTLLERTFYLFVQNTGAAAATMTAAVGASQMFLRKLS